MKRHQHQRVYQLVGGMYLGAILGLPALAPPDAALEPVRRLAQSYTGMIARTLHRHYALKYPAPVMTTGMSFQQAGRLQVEFLSHLQADLGPIIGFKAALTNPAAQQQFGVNHPLYGFLLRDMLLENGDQLPRRFGARPVAEGDLLVRVGSEAINSATSDEELLASLDAVIPFMELPDLTYQPGANIDAAALIAVNLGARYGVAGTPIQLKATEEWFSRLGQIQVHLVNHVGQTQVVGSTDNLMGHPINAVRWLRDTLASHGIRLRTGDLLSLGSVTPPIPVQPGEIRVRYFGLDPNLPPNRSLDVFITLEAEE